MHGQNNPNQRADLTRQEVKEQRQKLSVLVREILLLGP
jgi:hypothetical protein